MTDAQQLADLRQRIAAKVAEWRGRLKGYEPATAAGHVAFLTIEFVANEIEAELLRETAHPLADVLGSCDFLEIVARTRAGEFADQVFRESYPELAEKMALAEPVFAFGERGE